jgi:hypothetical protein
MALAAIGGLITILVTAFINGRCQRDFAQEWSRSLRVKREPRRNHGGNGSV